MSSIFVSLSFFLSFFLSFSFFLDVQTIYESSLEKGRRKEERFNRTEPPLSLLPPPSGSIAYQERQGAPLDIFFLVSLSLGVFLFSFFDHAPRRGDVHQSIN